MKNTIMIFLLTNSLMLSISAMDNKVSGHKRKIEESAPREDVRNIDVKKRVSSNSVLSKRRSSSVQSAKPRDGATH